MIIRYNLLHFSMHWDHKKFKKKQKHRQKEHRAYGITGIFIVKVLNIFILFLHNEKS